MATRNIHGWMKQQALLYTFIEEGNRLSAYCDGRFSLYASRLRAGNRNPLYKALIYLLWRIYTRWTR